MGPPQPPPAPTPIGGSYAGEGSSNSNGTDTLADDDADASGSIEINIATTLTRASSQRKKRAPTRKTADFAFQSSAMDAIAGMAAQMEKEAAAGVEEAVGAEAEVPADGN